MNEIHGEPAKLIENYLREIVPDKKMMLRFEITEPESGPQVHIVRCDNEKVKVEVKDDGVWKAALKNFVVLCCPADR